MIDLQPDWPFEPRPAQVRTWELLLLQVLLGVTVSATVVRLLRMGDTSKGTWCLALIHAACAALLVLVLGDARLGAAARFATSGRFALGLIGMLGYLVVLDIWFGREWGIDGISVFLVVGLLPLAGCAAIRNVVVTHPVRPGWCWVPLTAAIAQGCSVFLLRR